jgi:hypothetical protein
MPTAKLSDAQPIPQSGRAKLSDAQPLDQNIDEKRKWYSLTPDQKKAAIYGMSPEELDDKLNKLGVSVGHATSIGKAPEWTGFEARSTGNGTVMSIPQLTPESKQWMKQKALGLLNWGQENLSNIAGPFGAHVGRIAGAAVGEYVAPESGPIGPEFGGYAGEVSGASIAGAGAEAVRQGLEHVEGVDKYNEPWRNTWAERRRRIIHAGIDQAIAQGIGMGIGKAIRPTLGRSINNLYSAGMFDYGDPIAKEATVGTGKSAYKSGGTLEKVINDVMETEKAGKPAVTVRDLYDNINDLKKDIGTQVDEKMNLPVRQGKAIVPLKDVAPNPTPLADLINNFATKDEGIVHRASLTGRDPSVTAAKKYLQMVKDRALTFQQKPWTYGQLAKERIRIGNELNDYYSLTPDGKRLFLSTHPLFEVDKSIADYIRKVTYPEMDRLSGQPLGTTAELQGKRGALISLENQLLDNMEKIYTESRQGATKGMNIGGYATPSGVGVGLHRLPMKLGANDVESQANTKVARAFGHTLESKARKIASSPGGSEVWGDNILSLPIRALIGYRDSGILSTRPTRKPPAKSYDSDGPQSSVAPTSTPKELMEKAKRMAPAGQGQVAYNHLAVNPKTGHRIASADGKQWYDAQTGQQVA